MHLNHPKTIPTSCPGPWKTVFHKNSSLVSKMLGTTGLYDPNIFLKKKREERKRKKKLSEIIFGWWIMSESLYIYLFQIFYREHQLLS